MIDLLVSLTLSSGEVTQTLHLTVKSLGIPRDDEQVCLPGCGEIDMESYGCYWGMLGKVLRPCLVMSCERSFSESELLELVDKLIASGWKKA